VEVSWIARDDADLHPNTGLPGRATMRAHDRAGAPGLDAAFSPMSTL
jgi:hypothetical protein